MVLEKNKIIDMPVFLTQLMDVIKDYMSFERVWRDVLQDEDNVHLRGEDWSHGKILDQNYQINTLGRKVGYNQDVKVVR